MINTSAVMTGKGKKLRKVVIGTNQQATDLMWNSESDHQRDLSNHLASGLYAQNFYNPHWDNKVKSKTPNWQNNYNYFNGVAQGSALSPTLSTVLLTELLFLKHPELGFVYYADDGLIYSDKPFNAEEILNSISKDSGIVAHTTPPKSKWVKYDGKWLNNLKFLGREYIPDNLTSQSLGEFKNATRTPKDYVFNLAEIIGIAIEYDFWFGLGDEKTKGKILEKPFAYGRRPSMSESWKDSKYYGWSTSRIYNGSNEDIPLDPKWKEYNFNEGSWSHLDSLSKESNPVLQISKGKGSIFEKSSHETTLFTASSFATHFMLSYLSNSGKGKSSYKNSTLSGKFRKIEPIKYISVNEMKKRAKGKSKITSKQE